MRSFFDDKDFLLKLHRNTFRHNGAKKTSTYNNEFCACDIHYIS